MLFPTFLNLKTNKKSTIDPYPKRDNLNMSIFEIDMRHKISNNIMSISDI